MIKITKVSKKFTTMSGSFQALKNVSLNLEDGLIHGIIGPSGAGKSTLIRTLNMLEVYDSGSIDILEYKDIKTINKESTRMLRKNIGMIFQNFNLLDRQTVFNNIAFPIKLIRSLTKLDIININSLIDKVGLSEYKNSYPSQLSGGQKQRVGIARALVNNPKILLCDEPTSALDTSTIRNILNLIKELKSIYSLTVILVSHDMNVIKEICDTVTVMDKGEVIEHDVLDDIIFHPKHDVTKALLSTIGFNLDELVQKYKDYPNLSLLRFGKTNKLNALISEISIKNNAHLNILYANITPKEQGIMLVSILGTKQNTKIVFDEFVKEGVEIDYVQ